MPRVVTKKKHAHPSAAPIDLRSPLPTVPELHATGVALRDTVPRESHGQWKAAEKGRDILAIIRKTDVGRQKQLLPLKAERMSASPFAFLRGTADIMAFDLANTPTTGAKVVLAGDAHLNNFGVYGTPQRELVFDINDFDETVIGPWEWDLKRLTASTNVAGRENGLSTKERRRAVAQAVAGYQQNISRLESMGTLDTWYVHAYPGKANVLRSIPPKAAAVIKKVSEKAFQADNHTLLKKIATKDAQGMWRFQEDPPVLTRVPPALREKLVTALEHYATTLTNERRYMLSRYRVHDAAHRIVGVGSVGTRAYLMLLMGKNDDDPLFLQVKEATSPALRPHLPGYEAMFDHEGQRVVIGQRALQASSDVMLGWTSIDGRPYYVRQMKNLKASIPIEWMTGETFNFYALACGAILARAHARTGEAAIIAGYCGRSAILRESLADWAEAYADQNQIDFERFAASAK